MIDTRSGGATSWHAMGWRKICPQGYQDYCRTVVTDPEGGQRPPIPRELVACNPDPGGVNTLFLANCGCRCATRCERMRFTAATGALPVRQRQRLGHQGSGNTQSKGGVSATKAVETHRAKAVFQPRRQWKRTGKMRCLSHEGSGNTQSKGGVSAMKALETHREKAVSQP